MPNSDGTGSIAPRDVREALLTRREIALIDLREEAPFARAHPLFAAQLSLGRLEMEVLDRIPRKATPIVIYDDGEGLTGPAAKRLGALGYTNVRVMEDGLEGWKAAGYETFQDVNSYSKAFGELVEACRHTPSLPAECVNALIEEHADIVILDARRFEEYRTMSIPGGISTPGAELVLRARDLAPDPATTIIVNCAGRTRSLIGAQSLVNVGLPNPVFALRNGTIGWTLAGQSLEYGQTRSFGTASDRTLAVARQRAREVAYRAGVRCLDPAGLERLASDERRTIYRFDVRTPHEYVDGHIVGFRSAPGGQLVQVTDMFAPVRGARIVLSDDIGPRANMTASWLAQMGWDVYVLDGGFDGSLDLGVWQPTIPELPAVDFVSPDELQSITGADAVETIDLGASRDHAKGHIPGARFALRAGLPQALPPSSAKPIVLVSPDGVLAHFAARDLLREGGHTNVRVLRGGTQAWHSAGLPFETGLANPMSPLEDIYKRPYEGTDNAAEAMQAYLDWEYGLVDQLARDGTHGFFVI